MTSSGASPLSTDNGIPSSGSQRVLAIALVVVGVLCASLTIYLFRTCVVDDAFISLRFVKNLLNGKGLVWNPGERVEGFSNLGFVWMTAGLGALGLDIVLAARLLGLLGAAMAVWLAPMVVWPVDQGGVLERAVARMLCLANFAFVYLAWTGMETCLFAGMLTATVYAFVRAGFRFNWLVGLLAGLSFTIRPEGLALGLLCVGAMAHWQGLKRALCSSGLWLWAGTVGGVELWRWLSYGAPVPNTSKVKGLHTYLAAGLPWYATSGDDIIEWLSGTGGALGLLLVLFAWHSAPDRRRLWVASWACAIVLAFEFYSGGDWMLGYRYLQPMVPLYLAFVGGGAVRAFASLRPARHRLMAGLGIGLALLLAVYSWAPALRFRQDIHKYPNFIMASHDMTKAAQWLAEQYPPEYQIVCWRIGALGFYSNLIVLDVYGLTDRYIASNIFNRDRVSAYLKERKPELILQKGRPGEPPARSKEMFALPYRFVREFPQGSEETWVLYELDHPALR